MEEIEVQTNEAEEATQTVVEDVENAADEAMESTEEFMGNAAEATEEAMDDAAVVLDDAATSTTEAITLQPRNETMIEIGKDTVYMMGISFILGCLFTIFVLVLLDFMRRKNEK